jgi:hypothetical protein
LAPPALAVKVPGVRTRTLAEKIEYSILSVLVHCHGKFEDSLKHWYFSLRLAFPEIENADRVRDAFQQLCADGVIELSSPWIGEYRANAGNGDLDFLALNEFTASLTTRGVVRWDAIRR